MSYLSIFTSIQRPHKKLQTEPSQKLYKHASEYKKISHYNKIHAPGKMLGFQHSKLLPKNIVYDKQSLYLEVLSLKIQLNQMIDENLKLKTKVTSLEKEIEKKNKKKIFSQKEDMVRYKKDPSDHNEVLFEVSQNKLVESLKGKLKQARRKIDVYESQNLKLKKMFKISKLHEVEVQNTVLLQENVKLSEQIEELLRKVEISHLLEEKNRHLQKNQKSFITQLKAFEKDIVTLQSYIHTLQLEQKYQITNTSIKQKRQLSRKTLSKTKIQSLAKNISDVKKYQNITKANGFRINKREIRGAKNIQTLLPLRKQPINTNLNSPRKQQQNANGSESVKTQEKGKKDHLMQTNRFADSKKRIHRQQIKSDYSSSIIQKLRKKSQIVKNDYSSVTVDELGKNVVQNGLQAVHSKAFSQPQSPKVHSKHVFKSNKKLLKDIQQLLTYRMMAQRYTYDELINDIQQSQTKQFTYIDLCHMFVNEPFYLTVDYCRYLLNFIFQKDKPSHNDIVGSVILISKLRKILNDFELKSEEQENVILQNCTKKVTSHSKELKNQFSSANLNKSTIGITQLQRILGNYQFLPDEITLIIGELAICSSDLLHLNYEVIFQRFDLDQVFAQEQGNVIEQLENDDSFIGKSKHVDEKHKKEQMGSNQKEILDQNKKMGESKKK